MTDSRQVISMRVDPVGPEEAVALGLGWAATEQSRVICAANVHMIMEARDDPAFGALLSHADLVVADGKPVWLACRLLGAAHARHLRGQDLMMSLCAAAQGAGVPIGLFGSTEVVLRDLRGALGDVYPELQIAFAVAPPFRPLTAQEDVELFATLRESGARLLFVGLGCPKQERWMLEHSRQTPCVMIGVGAAFDMVAGRQRAAPEWMQRAGLEWLFRLLAEPRRLWRRYAKHNTRFVALLLSDVVRQRLNGRSR